MIQKRCFTIAVLFFVLSLGQQVWADIFVASYDNSSIRIFDNQADGDVAPIGVIEGDQTGLSDPAGVYVIGGEIFVCNYGNNSITVYRETDRNNVAPLRTITGITNPLNLTVSGGEIFVVSNTGDAIYVFNTTDSGAASPIRTITGDLTKLSNPNGVVVSGGEIFIAQTVRKDDDDLPVLVFGVSDSGNVAPKRAIGGGLTGIHYAYGIDVAQGEIFVFDEDSLRVFPVSQSGNVSPSRVIEGGNTNLTDSDNDDSVVINGEIFLSNYANNAICVFNSGDNGNVAPKRTIQGANTGIEAPYDNFVTVAPETVLVPSLSSTGVILLTMLLGMAVIFRIRRSGAEKRA